ncbi:hypothetical protein Q5I06_08630, partial [Helicobacter sp. faydin-H76]
MTTSTFIQTILRFDAQKTRARNLYSPPPIGLLEVSSLNASNDGLETKKSNKTFFPLFSLVLSTFLLPFTADIAKADDPLSIDHGNRYRVEAYSSGDARCLLNGSGPCARVTFSKNGLFNITKDSNKNDVYHFTE